MALGKRFWVGVMGLATLALVGCGGGGSSSGGGSPAPGQLTFATTADIAGSYWVAYLRGESDSASVAPTPLAVSGWGDTTGDAAGTLLSSVFENDTTVVTGPTGSSSPYTVGSEGQFRILTAVGGSVVWEGGACGDGSAALAATTGAVATVPAILVLARSLDGAFSNASLTGTWRGASFGVQPATPTPSFAIWASHTFDGAGSHTFSPGSVNSDGTVGPAGGGTAGYAVDGAGATPLTGFDGIATCRLCDGARVLLGSSPSTAPTSFAGLRIYLPTGTGMSTASLNGPYWFVAMFGQRTTAGPGDIQALQGTCTFDGTGTANLTGMIENVESAIAARTDESLSYSVAGDGAITAQGGAWTGQVGPDGKWAFLTGETSSGADPFLMVLLRKSP